MIRLSIFCFLIFCVLQFTKAQNFQWAKQIGGSAAASSNAVDASGNVFTIGKFGGTCDFDPGPGVYNMTSGAGGDIFISKLDVLGNFVWAKQIYATLGGYANDIKLDASGNIYLTGYCAGSVIDLDPGSGAYFVTSAGGWDVFVVKCDPNCNLIWGNLIGGADPEMSHAITVDLSGNVYTAGKFWGTTDFDPGIGVYNLSANSGRYNIFISKLDATGNFVWAKVMKGTGNDDALSITTDGSGDVFTTGSYRGITDFDPGTGVFNLNSSSGITMYVSKLTASGNFVWAKEIARGGTCWSAGESILVDPSGNIYTTGSFTGLADFDPGPSTYSMSAIFRDAFVEKLNSSGNFIWARQMKGKDYGLGTSLALDALNNVYTAGIFKDTVDFNPGPLTYTLGSQGDFDAYVSKLDASGNFVWAVSMGGSFAEDLRGCALDPLGNIYTSGTFSGTADFDPSSPVYNLTSTGTDVFVSKLGTSPLRISESSTIKNISVYPNPTSDNLNIELNGVIPEAINTTVKNILGQTVLESAFKNNITVSSLNSGIYFLIIKDNKGEVYRSQFVKD